MFVNHIQFFISFTTLEHCIISPMIQKTEHRKRLSGDVFATDGRCLVIYINLTKATKTDYDDFDKKILLDIV